MLTKQQTQIRWMIRRDMPEVLAIGNECFEHPWTEENFIVELRERCVIGMVAERDNRVVGYMVYELQLRSIELLNFAVHPVYHRCGIGTAMMAKLKGKLSEQRRRQIRAVLAETNLGGHLFFQRMGFWATEILPEHWKAEGEDGYVFEFDI